MGAKVQGHPTGAQPHEGSDKGLRSSLYGRPGTTIRIPVHSRGAALPPPREVQNASDQNV